jgi:phage shock protein C
MQPRLTRSRNEAVIAGVCGGLAEYFHIDPVIVRMIFVLVTVTSGLGLLVYPVLWIVMPQGAAPAGGAPLGSSPPQLRLPGEEAQQGAAWEPQAVRLREPAQQVGARSATPPPFADQPPPPEAYVFDPLTGEPIQRDRPSTGQTVDLSRHPAGLVTPQADVAPAPAPTNADATGRRRISWAGVILLGLGVMLLAEQIGVDPDIMFPILMVAVGALLLFRKA